MKKKLILMLALVAMACLLTLSVNASPEKPDLGVSFGDVQTIPNFTPPSQKYVDTDERVVLYDGTNYITYPTYYITADVTTFNDNDSFSFDALNIATGKSYSFKSVILVELPEGITGLASWAVYECKNCIYVKVPSTIEKYSNSVFAETSWIQVVEFENGTTPVTMGDQMFLECKALKYVKLPNNLVSMGKEAFRWCTDLETLILGTSFQNFAAAGNSFSATAEGKSQIINIYMSKAFGSTGLNDDMFTWTSNATKDDNAKIIFHYTGTKKDAEDLQALAAKTSDNGKLTYATILSKDELALTAQDTTKNYIVYGYNLCDAFYDGMHKSSQISPCVVECLICNDKIVNHISDYESLVVEYANGFMANGKKAVVCTNEGCGFKNEEDLNPLFSCLGYSAYEAGGDGIAIGYMVNNEAIDEYTSITGKNLTYGVFVASQSKLGGNDIFDQEGNKANGVVSVEITSSEFAVFELKVVGFTDENKGSLLAMGAYVKITDGENAEYSYMQDDTKGEQTGDYYFVSYVDIVGKTSVE